MPMACPSLSAMTIHLDESSFARQPYSSILITGFLESKDYRMQYDSSSQLSFVGTQHVGSKDHSPTSAITLYKHMQAINCWEYNAIDDSYYAPFCFRIPGHLPPTITANNVVIQYNVMATTAAAGMENNNNPHSVTSTTISTASTTTTMCHPVELIDTSLSVAEKSLLFLPRLYWGTSSSKRWRYEIEIPSMIPLTTFDKEESGTSNNSSIVNALVVRVQSCWNNEDKTQTKLEYGLIGCQIIESIGTEAKCSKPIKEGGSVAMVTTHVLPSPRQTWRSPCRLPLTSFPEPPSPTLSSDFVTIRHQLFLTLSFHDTHHQADRVELSVPITLLDTRRLMHQPQHKPRPTRLAIPVKPHASTTNSASSSSSDDGDSRDSGVWLTS